MAGPAVSLNGSPTVSPMTVAACAARALAAVVRRPRRSSSRCPRRRRSWPGRPPSACRSRSRRPGRQPSAPTPRPKPTAIGARTASRPGVASSRSESRVQMSTTLPYSGLLGAVHDPGVLAELAAHLEDDRAGRAGHRVDRQAGEQEHHRGADEQADQVASGSTTLRTPAYCRFVGAAVERRRPVVDDRGADRVGERAEQRGRGEHRGRDRDALGDRLGGVADRVEVGEHPGALARRCRRTSRRCPGRCRRPGRRCPSRR